LKEPSHRTPKEGNTKIDIFNEEMTADEITENVKELAKGSQEQRKEAGDSLINALNSKLRSGTINIQDVWVTKS
jgi:hypothetical protein